MLEEWYNLSCGAPYKIHAGIERVGDGLRGLDEGGFLRPVVSLMRFVPGEGKNRVAINSEDRLSVVNGSLGKNEGLCASWCILCASEPLCRDISSSLLNV